jgi:ADP-ribose pyrophosphatase
MTWILNNRDKCAESRNLTFVKDIVTSPSGKQLEYGHVRMAEAVLVVPIKIGSNNSVSFVLTKQYRYPAGKEVLEFPGGSRNPDETPEKAAARELLEETGYQPKSLKFLYVLDTAPAVTSAKTYVYVAIIDEKQSDVVLDEDEKDFGLSSATYTADNILKMLVDNEITDCKTVAALAAVLLQSPKALEYANSLTGV